MNFIPLADFETIKNMKINMVDVVGQFQGIKEPINQKFQEIFESGAFVNGPAVQSFKKNFSEYLDVKYVIPCGNGTDALQIALMSLDLSPDDEVITVPFTFHASAEVIALLGYKLVFVDVEPDTFNIDIEKLKAAITPKTKCIVPIHLFGQSANMEEIMKIAEENNIFVIEDSAQSIGSDFIFKDGTRKKSGTIGHIGCTSFYPSKNLGCFGDGGAIFTDDDALAEKIVQIANHGSKVRYHYEMIGVNSRLDSFQAAVLDVKLPHLDKYNENRRKAADFYDEKFKELEGVTIPFRLQNSTHTFHQYTLRIGGGAEKRDELQEKLMESGVPSMIYYPIPLHVQEAYAKYNYKEGDFPVSEELCTQVISLPMHSELDNEQLEYISSTFIRIYQSL